MFALFTSYAFQIQLLPDYENSIRIIKSFSTYGFDFQIYLQEYNDTLLIAYLAMFTNCSRYDMIYGCSFAWYKSVLFLLHLKGSAFFCINKFGMTTSW